MTGSVRDINVRMEKMSAITVSAINNTTFVGVYDFKDGVDGRQWRDSIQPFGTLPIRLTSDQSLDNGYGTLLWHRDGSAPGWTESSLLHDGDTVQV
jgi:hypothetical protein